MYLLAQNRNVPKVSQLVNSFQLSEKLVVGKADLLLKREQLDAMEAMYNGGMPAAIAKILKRTTISRVMGGSW